MPHTMFGRLLLSLNSQCMPTCIRHKMRAMQRTRSTFQEVNCHFYQTSAVWQQVSPKSAVERSNLVVELSNFVLKTGCDSISQPCTVHRTSYKLHIVLTVRGEISCSFLVLCDSGREIGSTDFADITIIIRWKYPRTIIQYNDVIGSIL